MDQLACQRLHMSLRPNISNQIGYNSVSEERCAVHCPFGHIEETVDPVGRPKDRNTFRVNFLFDALRKLIKRRHSDRITRVTEGETGVIPVTVR
jgi:hypothetical protein